MSVPYSDPATAPSASSAAAATSALRDRLQPHWPAMVQRLGDRWPAFEATVRERAQRHGIADEAALVRYAGLCLSFGPSFEDRPEHEGVLAVLADERLPAWVKLHQAVRRAVDALQRRGGDAAGLQRADAAVADALAAEAGQDPAGAPLRPRAVCDIEALELRLCEPAARSRYAPVDGGWQRRPEPVPAPLRAGPLHPLPSPLHVLASVDGPPAQLQLRQVVHGGCGEAHPALRWLDTQGERRWQGHEARSVRWPLRPLPPAPVADGLATPLVEETHPAVQLLSVASCGLRDQAVPVGRLEAAVWTWPDTQWLMALQRSDEPAVARPTPAAPALTRCRLERDGDALAAPGWQRGFDQSLPAALQEGLERLEAAWSQSARQPLLRAELAPFTGRAVLAWGWAEGEAGLAVPPVMRLQGEVDLTHRFALELVGEVALAGSRAHLRLAAGGQARAAGPMQRLAAATPMAEVLKPATARWRLPFSLDLDPVAEDHAMIWSAAGPCTGALVGEAGLRPRTAGSGWQWFLRLSLEPVVVPVLLHDPVLGQQRRSLALLPALALADWSLG